MIVRYGVCTKCGYRECELLTAQQKRCDHAWRTVTEPMHTFPNGTYSPATVRHFADTMTTKDLAAASNKLNALMRGRPPSDRLVWINHTRMQLSFAMALRGHEHG